MCSKRLPVCMCSKEITVCMCSYMCVCVCVEGSAPPHHHQKYVITRQLPPQQNKDIIQNRWPDTFDDRLGVLTSLKPG